MDDTQQSRVSDAAAAASRKRRSSILKSQRPARTPFSELEFNVATPTDTAKSRRVSFSRRTGVAEFVTNEATTTWKNFYEEHNKSLESSSNDSEANASRQPVGHLGKRIFDQQFEEVEAVDFISGLANGSLNNVNFSQQLASLECTADGKLTAPQNKFELSAFTEQSKLFGNDFTAPSIGDNSGRIDVNFSAIQQVEKDDLDEIEKDLERGSSNMGCHDLFSNGQNMSEYIEVDLNMTHVVKNDEDMSITDTVHSPVQDVSKSASIDKKASLHNDWVADKENIAMNPYDAPCETNFAVNEEPDQVLVFDGKRLTLQPDIPEKDKNYRQTLLPNSSAETPQRKTIVLNVNDDLPNFIDDNNMLISKNEHSGFSGFQEMNTDEDEISETVSVHREDIKCKRKTIHDYSGNISMTQALPTNIICHAAVISQDVNSTKRRTIVFNESTSNISMTETLPVKLLNSSATLSERSRNAVYEDDTGNISITQAVPSKILVNENSDTTKKYKTIVFDSDEDNISITQALSSNILDEKASARKTIMFDDGACNVSFTQALPANIMLPDMQTQEKRRTIIYENDTGNISVKQALPTNVILPKIETNREGRRSVLYDDDTGNVSVTQALPSNIILEKDQLDHNKKSYEAKDILATQYLPTNITTRDCETSRRRTIVFANDTGNISITQAIPAQLIPGYSEEKPIHDLNTSKQPKQLKTRNKKGTTIVSENDEGDISMTEAISANIIEKATNERKTIVYDEDEAISMTLAISANDFLLDKLDSPANIKKPGEVQAKITDYDVFEQDNIKATEDAWQDNRTSTVFDANNLIFEMSMITEIPTVQSLLETENRRTIIFDNDNCDISMTKPIPAGFKTVETEMLNKTKTKLDETEKRRTVIFDNDNCDISMTKPIPAGFKTVDTEMLNKTKTKLDATEKRRTIIFDNDNCDISMTKPIPAGFKTVDTEMLNKTKTKLDATEKRRTIIFDNDNCDISMTKPIPAGFKTVDTEMLNKTKTKLDETEKRRTIIFDNDNCDISMTKPIPAGFKTVDTEMLNKTKTKLDETEKRRTIIFDNDNYDISMTTPIPAGFKTVDTEMLNKTKTKLDETEKRRTIIFDNDNYDISMTKPIPAGFKTVDTEMLNKTKTKLDETEKRRTIIFDNDNCDISMTKPIPAGFITVETNLLNKTETKLDVTAQNQAAHPQLNVIVVQASTTNSKYPINLNVEKAYDSKVELPIKLCNVEEVQVKLMASTDSTDQNIDKVFEDGDDAIIQTGDEERKESQIIASESSFDSNTDDKSFMAVLESNSSSGDIPMDGADNNSTSSMFYITKDCEAVIQTDSYVRKTVKEKEDELEQVDHLERKLAKLQTDVSQNSDLSDVKRLSQISNKANDTQNLLDLISKFTDNGDSEDDVKPVAVQLKDQGETTEHKRLSVAPNRQSIALSREDLLSNISMAQAALQQSRLALDDSDSVDEDTGDASLDMPKNSDRTSYEVVKTLNFDDESTSEASLRDEEKISPLKKTVFGETSYMKETKGKVIPTYLKDVSDGIKELMLDLVKPLSDNMPFQSGLPDRDALENTSTHSTQVQANLTTSSQIDIDYELISIAGVNLDRVSASTSETVSHLEKSNTRAFRNQVKFTCLKETEMSEEPHEHSHSKAPIKQPPPSEVLVFDHLNPLNNVLLAPTNLTVVHKYNPRQTDEMLCESRSRFNNMSNGNNYEVETVTTTQFTLMPEQTTKQENIYVYPNGDQFSQNYGPFDLQSTSTTSARTSVDQSVAAIANNLRDDEVNTLIAMRGNKELLQASSSLTLVDDLSEGENSKLTSNNKEHSTDRIKLSRSPLVNTKGHTAEIDNIAELSGISLQDGLDSSNLGVNTTKGKKRIYSPSTKTNKHYSPSREVTPKPITKMQKISRSPKQHKVPINMSPRNDSTLNTETNNQKVYQSKNSEKKSPKTSNTKSGQTITVQQLITDYQNFETELEHKNKSEKKFDVLNVNPKSESTRSQSDASFTSSKNLKSTKDDNSTGGSTGFQSPQRAPVQDTPWQMDWHPELMGTTRSNLSETDSGVNVVAKIDMLPFMGSHECEWDPKSVADTWSFRLQHGRLRLTTRLAHRHDNATRTRVRGDTPVLDITVETVQHDRKNPVATLCVRFALETMRYMVTHTLRTPCYAKEIPQLLRRCAAVTRVALRWGRAMHDAKLQLAYTMDNDGNISLKVANIRLRSVWEVTMHIELVVDDDRSVPWPKADNVRVTRVVSELLVPDADVRRVLSFVPRDWGHAPRTIWRIFRYLKHKTRDDNIILA